ncbi:MAG TPA: hypothetical protein VF789_06750 [Thermoanaerobaculia bacterium]
MRNFTILLCAGALLLGGCATRYQKRGTEAPITTAISLDDFEKKVSQSHQLDLEARSIERFSNPQFTVGVIELTDEGFINRQQYEQVMYEVRETFKNAKEGAGSLLVVFAHGWHHGCRTCDRDLACFRRVLGELQEDEKAKDESKRRSVIGVYLGWRGVALSGKLNTLTIWNRKRVAEHIGRTGGKEVLAALHKEWLEHKETNKPVTMVTVGHSLGGALIFSAVKDQLSGNVYDILKDSKKRGGTYRIVRAQGERGPAEQEDKKAIRSRFGDLVVLVNPAIEAGQYWPFDNDLPDDRFNDWGNEELIKSKLPLDKGDPYDKYQLPVLLTIASDADTAVGRWFPIFRVFSVLNVLRNGEVFRDEAESVGMGRYRPQFTHRLHYQGTPPRDIKNDVKDNEISGATCGCSKTWEGDLNNEMDKAYLPLEDTPMKPDSSESSASQTPDAWRFQFDLVEERKCKGGGKCKGWDPHSPYFVVSTDKSVIREHSDIFNPVFTGFLRKFLAAFENKKPRDPGAVY